MILSYSAIDPMREERLSGWREMFAESWLRAGGEVRKALQDLEDAADRKRQEEEGPEFADILAELERMGLVKDEGSGFAATSATRRAMVQTLYRKIFSGKDRKDARRELRPEDDPSARRERLPIRRPWTHGDDVREVDWSASLGNAARRGAAPRGIRESDLEVWESEILGSSATVLMVDISHSMVDHGEDRMTPAKMVAIGLAEHLRREGREHTLDVVAFGNAAWTIPVESIERLQAGPFQTNTAEGLRLARRILSNRRASRKRILMLTDGKPTCITLDGKPYRNTVGLDRRIVERTLSEGRMCRRDGIKTTTFMLAREPQLVEFVERFTTAVGGEAFFTGTSRLGEFVRRGWGKG